MKHTSKHRLLGQKAGCWDTPNRKGFRNIPDKRRGITTAMLAGRQYFIQ